MAGLGLLARRRAIQAFPVENPVGTIMKEALCWYDNRIQGSDNAELSANPYLQDLTGNGYNLQLSGFSFDGIVDGVQEDKSILFNGKSSKGLASGLPILTDYTIIARRVKTASDNYTLLAAKGNAGGDNRGAFGFETSNKTRSFTKETRITYQSAEVSWQTKESYNGQTLAVGTATDDAYLNVGYFYDYGQRWWKGYLFAIIIFPRSLTQDEINLVINNVI